jgi:two-component system sensor kinase FixL
MKGCRRLLDGSEDPATARIRDALDKAGDQALRAGQIIRRLRDFLGRGETERRNERVTRLIEEASALSLGGIRERGVMLRVDIDPEVTSVFVDRVQIQQVLVNLFRNAFEAMYASKKRELVVSVKRIENSMAEISVSDTGHGISTDVLEKLFEPFVTTKESGMGVGLSISKRIIESHGGRLWAEANPCGGTVFHFTIIASEAETEADGR